MSVDLMQELRDKHDAWQKQYDEWIAKAESLGGIDVATIERMRRTVYGEAADTLAAKDTALAVMRVELERAETSADNWKQSHGRVVEGFAEVCEAVGVQFDAPEAVAYAINTKISNAEHDKRAAEAELARARKALEAGKQLANVAYNIGQLGHVTEDGSLRSLREAQLAFDAAVSASRSIGPLLDEEVGR